MKMCQIMVPSLKKKTKKCSISSHCLMKPRNKCWLDVMFCAVIMTFRCDLHTLPEGSVMTIIVLLYSMLFEIRHLWPLLWLSVPSQKMPMQKQDPLGWRNKQEGCRDFCSVQQQKWVLFFIKEPRVWEYLSTVQHLFPLKIISGLHDPQTGSCLTVQVQKRLLSCRSLHSEVSRRGALSFLCKTMLGTLTEPSLLC